MMFRLPTRVPIRLRFFFRAVFALLALATLALAVTVLRGEKQRNQREALESLRQHGAQIAARLRHPTGQLALLNAGGAEPAAAPMRPLLLPFSAIDFDDKAKAQQAVEMAGCLWQYPDTSTLCVAVGNNPSAGGFIYAVGSFVSGELVPHLAGDLEIEHAHRVRIDVDMRGRHFGWVAPFELLPDAGPGVRGRLTGYPADRPVAHGDRPVRDFRGWLWQDGRCSDGAVEPPCNRRSFMSVRLPVEMFRDDLYAKRLVWPPPDLDRIQVRVRVLPPDEDAPLFDSNAPGAQQPFSFGDLRALLTAGETLHVRPLLADGKRGPDLLTLRGAVDGDNRPSPWMVRLINRLPVEGEGARLEASEVIATTFGQHDVLLIGDPRVLDRNLAGVATRLSWFVGAMLLAVLVAWLAIEIRIIRRITVLTRRAALVSNEVRASDGVANIDLSDLRGGDELGVLAQGLGDLLQRVNEDVRRDRIRAEQEKDLWHAVGHEIMSPLQSLMALHGTDDDPSHRYISRMQQAVRVLYGHASPSEAFEATMLQLQPLDLREFLVHVAANARYIGIDAVTFDSPGPPVPVRADEYPLEDAVTHVLRNANRYRVPGTAIRIELTTTDTEARASISNQGPAIPDELIDRVFEYGVSDQEGAAAEGQRGQGLFVARTYMAKMGGTIQARNMADGVMFTLTLPKVAEKRQGRSA